MSDPEQARILLDAARRDLTALHGMDDAEIFADEIFGFHVQQTVEKLLKAWLTLKGVSYPRTHDLRLLINQLAQHGVDPGPLRALIEYQTFAGRLRYEGLPSDDNPLDRDAARNEADALFDRVQLLLGEAEGA